MKGLNLRDFKKVSGDEHHTVMQSPKGHQITVLHKPLAKAHADALKALPVTKMADGGKVSDTKKSEPGIPGGSGSPAIDQDKAAAIAKGATEGGTSLKQGWQNIRTELGFAQGGQVQKFAGGTPTQPIQDTPESIAADAQAAPVRPEYAQFLAQEQAKSNPQMDAVYGDAATRAQQELNKQDADAAANAQGKSAYEAQQSRILAGVNEKRASEGQPPLASLTPTSPQAQKTNPPTPAPAQASPTGATPQPGGSATDPYADAASLEGGLLRQGVNEEKAGKYAGAEAEGKLGQQQAAISGQTADHLQQSLNTYQGRLAELDQEHARYLEDLQNGHIDPNRLLNGMSTGQRLQTGIGVFLGGLGAGLTKSGSNQALDFLNKQIDRDIDAQKSELGKKENLLSVNMRQYGNLHDAAEATRVQLQAATSAKLNQAAEQAAGPIAKARALEGAGKLDEESSARFGALRMRQGLGAALSGGQAGAVNIPAKIQMLRLLGHKDMADDLSSRYVPSLGAVAGKPVPQATIDKISAHQDFDTTAKDLLAFLNKGSSLSMHDRTVATQKAMNLQAKVREGLLNTVYREGEQPLLDAAVSKNPLDFTKVLMHQEPAKIQELIDANRRAQGIVHQSVDLPAPAAPAAAPEYAFRNGVKWVKNPSKNGWDRVK